MSKFWQTVLALAAILIVGGYALATIFWLFKWMLIGGGVYLGYRLFFSKNKQIKDKNQN